MRLIGISEGSVTIEWSKPFNDGGSTITGYVIEKRESQMSIWTRVEVVSSMTTSIVIQGLMSNATYFIRVGAENEEGVGEYRELGEAVVPRRPASELCVCVLGLGGTG